MLMFSFRIFLRGTLLASLLAIAPATANAQTVAGPTKVKDGDGLNIGGIEFRLHGIDAPETDQNCELLDGTSWPCGKLAAGELRSMI